MGLCQNVTILGLSCSRVFVIGRTSQFMPEDLNRHIGRLKDGWRKEYRETRADIIRLKSRLGELRQKLNNADEILAAEKIDARKHLGNKYANIGTTDAVR